MAKREYTPVSTTSEARASGRPSRRARIGLALAALGLAVGGAAGCAEASAQTPSKPATTATEQTTSPTSPEVTSAEHFLNRYDKVSVTGEPVPTSGGTKLTIHMDYKQSIEQARQENPGVSFNQEDDISGTAVGDKVGNPSVIYRFTQDGQSTHHQATADNPKDSRDTTGEIDAIMPGTPESDPSNNHGNFELYASNGGYTSDNKHYVEVVDPIAAFKAENGHWVQIPLPEADQHPQISVDGK